MAHADRARDPCPYVILNDAGGAFSMGAIGGTIWYAIKGSRNSPRVSIDWEKEWQWDRGKNEQAEWCGTIHSKFLPA